MPKKHKYLTAEDMAKTPRFTERGKQILHLIDQYTHWNYPTLSIYAHLKPLDCDEVITEIEKLFAPEDKNETT